MSFFLIKYHTDAEITAFLQDKAEHGYAFSKVVGNRFYFEKRPYDGNRICAMTLYRTSDEFSTELQVREALTSLRKKGWDCLAVGTQETLKDVKRHVYLKEEIKGSDIPHANDRSEKRAELRGKFKSLSNLLLCAIYVAALVILLTTSLSKVVSNNLYIVCTLIFAVLLAVCSYACISSFINAFFLRHKNSALDKSTRLVATVLFIFAFFLIADSFVQDRGKAERIKIGASVYNLYHDKLPVDLDDLGFDTSSPYRTSRKIQSESFLSENLYCFDESFGIKEGETVYDESKASRVSYISYTKFTSKYEWLRNAVASQIIPNSSCRNQDLEKLLDVQQAFVSETGSITICLNDSVILIKSGIPLSTENLNTLKNL